MLRRGAWEPLWGAATGADSLLPGRVGGCGTQLALPERFLGRGCVQTE
ncbi:hypothetical protein QFZ24_009833 [Streptomyces phaeochromogenes]|nr:hypothetical protein [Streptomyces phaeochromogenes]